MPAAVQTLPRRRRTPSSIAYRPPPLRFFLEPTQVELLDLGTFAVTPEATLFDFGGVSLALRAKIQADADHFTRLAGWLADPSPMVRLAKAVLAPLYQQLLPAVQNPQWPEDLSEEYFVFQLAPGELPTPARLLEARAAWLAGLLRLEAGPLSLQETSEALRLSMSYSPTDLLISDWALRSWSTAIAMRRCS